MKILITGGSGLLGQYLARAFSGEEVHLTYLSHPVPRGYQLDVRDREATLSLLSRLRPEVTIHTVAVPSMDLCETNKLLADRVNVEGTRNVADACKVIGGKIVYISTSYVFEGGEGITEDSPTQPVNYYGITKLKGEHIVSSAGIPFLILRTDQPYGWILLFQKKNSVVRALEFLERGQQIKEPEDWYNTPTFAGDFAAAAKKLIEKNKTGIFHVVGPDYLNRYEWSLKVAEVFQKDKNLVKSITSQELHLPAQRMNAKLSNKKLEKEAGMKMRGVREGLLAMKNEKEQKA